MKCWTVRFCIYAGKGPIVVMNQLKYIYNSPVKDLHSHPIQTCFAMIASNDIIITGRAWLIRTRLIRNSTAFKVFVTFL